MQTSPESDKVLAAFRAALVDCGNVSATKTADTGKYKYKYANLVDVLAAIEEACEKHHLSISQSIRSEGNITYCDTMLVHATGQWITFPGMGMQTDRDPQVNGSSVTYMRRYTLTALFAMGVEDDDGRTASASAKAPPPQRAAAKPTSKQEEEPTESGSPDVRRRAKEIMDMVPGKEKAAFAKLLKERGIESPLNPGVLIGAMEEAWADYSKGERPEEEAF